ncbi:unnamed protein product [Phytomonas sp. Hart1]|nr:unnamed protein product [Phytomonas sp. Hart1]|eukprot:CCW67064.1 unnamed protein product [Phytomonas sp. isolate Hart1]
MSVDFNLFIDHYILLLVTRFPAALSSTSSARDREQAWGWIAEAVQAVVAAPKTPTERLQAQQVESSAFSPSVCRARAEYLIWRLRQDPPSRRRGSASARARAPDQRIGRPAPVSPLGVIDPTLNVLGPGGGPSSFDVTQDSTKERVDAIYDAIRRQLPSSLVHHDDEDDSEDGERSDADAPAVEVTNGLRAAASRGGPNRQLKVVEVPIRSEEESRRYHVMASARNELLSEVQRLQSKFYATYHRWAEVPNDLVNDPAGMIPFEPHDRTHEMPNKGESEVKSKLLSTLFGPAGCPPSSASDAISALRSSVKVERPAPRPSRDNLEGRSAEPFSYPLYTPSSQIPSKVSMQEPFTISNTSSGKFPRAVVDLESDASLVKTHPHKEIADGLNIAAPNAALTVSIIRKETNPPSNRHGRWQTIHYNDNNNEDKD